MPEITKTESPSPTTAPKYVWVLMAILAVIVYFFGLTLPFFGPDESRYAQVAREMMERGDWITPTLGGFNWFEKPALLYWLQIVSYKIFGVHEFAARFGPAIFGLGTVACLGILGRRFTTEDTESTETETKAEIAANTELSLQNSVSSVPSVLNQFANYLALIAASSLGILVFSRGASFDIIITFPFTAALVSFFIFDRQSVSVRNPVATAPGSDLWRYLALFLFYVFIGVAVLAKGLIGIVFPFAIVGFYYLLSRRFPNRTFVISLIWGTALACAIAAIWYVPMYLRHGQEFIDEFIIGHHFQRFTSNKYRHPQPFYFFLWVLPLMTLPWLTFFLAAIWKITKGIFTRSGAETPAKTTDLPISPSPRLPVSLSPLLTFAAAWLLVPLVFFSFSGSKLPGYILPAVPAAIIITAVFVFDLVQKSRKWRNTVLVIGGSTFVTIIMLLVFVVPQFAEFDSTRTLIRTANERGYTTNRVLMLHIISHNAEFYAAGRLVRDETGKPRRFEGPGEILTEIIAGNGRAVLVLVPVKYLNQLTRDAKLTTDPLHDNGELAIAAVSAK